uniref:DNA2/NAM7 helicase-like C-terminal domain-containing protein n=1 Tax=Timema monikensis TaxID=170555 RepID=A0A7R9EAV5_9NEOP|nr:unnamed protein product [Timema monikensis]
MQARQVPKPAVEEHYLSSGQVDKKEGVLRGLGTLPIKLCGESHSLGFIGVVEIRHPVYGGGVSDASVFMVDVTMLESFLQCRDTAQKFKQAMKKKNWQEVSVGSVEEFQGQERLIIIISTVRSSHELLEDDYKFRLGFLDNPKRFNVAMTRAKSLLIVVGNPNILQCDYYWHQLLNYCHKNNAYRGVKFPLHKKSPVDRLIKDMKQLDINTETVTRCFEKAGFSMSEVTAGVENENDLQDLQNYMNEASFNNCNAEDYINIDNNVKTEPDTMDINGLYENFKEDSGGESLFATTLPGKLKEFHDDDDDDEDDAIRS